MIAQSIYESHQDIVDSIFTPGQADFYIGWLDVEIAFSRCQEAKEILGKLKQQFINRKEEQ